MNFEAGNVVASAQAGWAALSALAVTYAFSVVGALVLLVVGFIVAGYAERWSYAGLGRVRGFDETLRLLLSKILRYAILALVGVTVLSQFGVQTASIIAALGAAGLAIGLALQGTLQNIAAGIMLLVLKPFRVGEHIEAGAVTGTVAEIGLFATELRGDDGMFILSPNSLLWNQAVKNHSRNQQRRGDILLTVEGRDRLGDVLAGLRETIAADTRLKHPNAPEAHVTEIAGNTASVSVRFWTDSAAVTGTKRDLMEKLRTVAEGRGATVTAIK